MTAKSKQIFMLKRAYTAFIMTSVFLTANAQTKNNSTPLRGGMCFSIEALTVGDTKFNCEHIGKISSIQQIYDRGFRVVASGHQAVGPAPFTYMYLIIEERR